MGLVRAEIELISSRDLILSDEGHLDSNKIRKLKVRALVDSGAYMLAINELIRTQLDLPFLEKRTAELADGTILNLDVVGPIEIRFKNRRSVTHAMVLPGDAEVLLGAIPMEDMDVQIDPRTQELIVNPDHPYRAQMVLKGLG